MFRLAQLRHFSFYSSPATIEPLKNRVLLRISGTEVTSFLQGLITNDMAHLGNQTSMFAMFLNTQGRVLYDVIIYKQPDPENFIIDCDAKASDALQKHLKMYRVRRKIDICNLEEQLGVFALFSRKENPKLSGENPKGTEQLEIYRDPRVINLGFRILAHPNSDLAPLFNASLPINHNFRYLRYSLGVGEGVDDLPPGDCFPLECNCDYLHGVSFHKGCYIGQELTARVHHTGVIRKRLVPILFKQLPTLTPEVKITHENINLGKLRGMEQNVGLGLLRLDKAVGIDFKIGDGIAHTMLPSWWPIEPKEINVQKSQ